MDQKYKASWELTQEEIENLSASEALGRLISLASQGPDYDGPVEGLTVLAFGLGQVVIQKVDHPCPKCGYFEDK